MMSSRPRLLAGSAKEWLLELTAPDVVTAGRLKISVPG